VYPTEEGDPVTRHEVEATAREILSIDYGCDPQLFNSEKTVVLSHFGQGRWYAPARIFALLSFGSGVFVSCETSLLPWAKAHLEALGRDEIFSPRCLAEIRGEVEKVHPKLTLTDPFIRFLCASETLTGEPNLEGDVEVRLLEPPNFDDLYRRIDLRHVLSEDRNHLGPPEKRRDRLVVAAYRSDALAAVAGASADAAKMWNIGVDSLSGHRRKGLATRVVWQLTQRVLQESVAPYYSTRISNVASQRVAVRVGYWPCWIEAWAEHAPNAFN